MGDASRFVRSGGMAAFGVAVAEVATNWVPIRKVVTVSYVKEFNGKRNCSCGPVRN